MPTNNKPFIVRCNIRTVGWTWGLWLDKSHYQQGIHPYLTSQSPASLCNYLKRQRQHAASQSYDEEIRLARMESL